MLRMTSSRRSKSLFLVSMYLTTNSSLVHESDINKDGCKSLLIDSSVLVDVHLLENLIDDLCAHLFICNALFKNELESCL